ncbi:MAG: ABC-F family ATP-binding cassette domain-containing protein [Planctomycetota bacterium]
MPILSAINIEVSYGERRVLDAVSLTIEPGEKIGIVGRNGAGKSSLFRVLAGQLKADSGTVTISGGETAGYLSQEPRLHAGRTLREEAAAAFAHLDEMHDQLEAVFHDMGEAEGEALEKLLRKQERLEKQIEAAGGYAVDHKIDAVLLGLGLHDDRFGVPVEKLSGGQKARLGLAKLLLAGHGVLLLDEPTNHLDIEGRIWLETFLRDEYQGAVILISHDRALLDGVVERIVEVEAVPGRGGRLIEYPGNYAAFRELRADRILTQQRAWEKQQTAFKREEAFIRKYKAGQRAKQARGRESRLEREKEASTIERPMELASIRLNLPKAERTGDIVVSTRGLTKRYPKDGGGELTLYHDLDMVIERGQRWGIVGPNGAGKTTLVRTLLGEIESDAGDVRLGTKLAVGYFKQTHEDLDPELTVVRHLQRIVRLERPGEQLSEQAARDLAGAFLFSGADQEKELGLLSGGERARAVIAGLFVSAKNVLVLDEPTNHLDIPSAERLEEALKKGEDGEKTVFDGTVILISHDRALLDAVCDHLLVLDGHGNAEVSIGNWSEREARLKRKAEERERRPRKKPKPARAAKNAPPVPVSAPPAEKKSKWSWMRLEQIEEKIGHVEERLGSIDAELDDPEIWQDYERANELTEQRDALREELEGLEAEWIRKSG